MFIYGFLILLQLVFTIIECNRPEVYWLKNGNSNYCIITNEDENTALTLFNKSNHPVAGSQVFIDQKFQCSISTDEKCKDKFVQDGNNIWNYDVSDNYDLEPILDSRWEGLPTVETRKDQINILNVHSFNETDKDFFSITISIQIAKNAYIYLCDGVAPTNSRCYWFIIGGWTGKHSIIRKCEKNLIPNIHDVYPPKNTSCGKHPDNETEHRKANHAPESPITSKAKWTNFILTKNSSEYSIKREGDEKAFLRYEDGDENKILVKHLLVASLNDSPGQWKVNNSLIEYVTGGLPKIHSWNNKKNGKTLSFSVTSPTNEPTYLYLCKENHNSDCYKITLKSKDSIVCFFQKDPNRCKAIAALKAAINFSTWGHLRLQKHDNNYTLFNDNSSIVTFKDENIMNPGHAFLGSDNIAFWKVHSYGLFVANTSGNTIIDLIGANRGQRVCFAIFVHNCKTCDLAIKLQDDQDRILSNKGASKNSNWEELKLSTILKYKTNLKLQIDLNLREEGKAFIGDIRDCSRNLRILKSTNMKANGDDNISCNTLKYSNITTKDNKDVIPVPAFNSSITDVVWLAKNGLCGNRSSETLGEVLNCTINDTDLREPVQEEEFCSLAFERNRSIQSCRLYSESVLAKEPYDYTIAWVLGTLITLCLVIGIIYLYKKDKLSISTTSWMYIIPRTYSFITTELFMPTRTTEDALLLHLSDQKYSNFSSLVKTENFKVYVEQALRNAELLTQYNMLENMELQPRSVGLMEEHIRKNRYKNIIAYDATRVKLESTYNNTNDDYINANFIKCYDKEKAFIASQGPTATTIDDFWRMIWQEKVKYVVMLSKIAENGKKKCEKYWPELNDTFDCCAFKVTCMTSSTINDDITLRKLKVKFNSEEREITQIHYEGWLDHNVPESPTDLINILKLLKDFEMDDNPIVIHCSAGVGRTGALILCHIALKMAEATKTVDVFSCLYELRQQRIRMVQNFDQYVYVHKVIATVLETL